MYAIVKTGGKQYRVERGQRLRVERLDAAVGDTVALTPLLVRSDEAIFDAKALAGATVSAKILAHERGEKLRVFKYKPKRGYKKRNGHRQELTRIEVSELSAAGGAGGAGKQQAGAKTEAVRARTTEAKDAADGS